MSYKIVADEAQNTFKKIKELNKIRNSAVSGQDKRDTDILIDKEKDDWWSMIYPFIAESDYIKCNEQIVVNVNDAQIGWQSSVVNKKQIINNKKYVKILQNSNKPKNSRLTQIIINFQNYWNR